jgi:hypothetical protein
MPFRLDRLPDFLVLTMSGIISPEDLRRIASEAAEVEDNLTVTPNRLIEMTQIESMAVGFSEVLALAAARRKRRFPNDFKSAFLISTEVQKGYARMYQTLNDHPRIRIEIFTDRKVAEAWLKTPL